MSNEARRGDAKWLRDQLVDLADHLVLASLPASMQEIRCRLGDISIGKPWRQGCVERGRRGG